MAETPNSTPESPKPVEELSYDEYKARDKKPAPVPQAAGEEKPSVTEGKPKPEAKTAEAPESSPKQQEKKPHQRKPDSEARIHELMRENRELREQAEKNRTTAATPQVTQPAPVSQPIEQPAGKPEDPGTLKEYRAKWARAHGKTQLTGDDVDDYTEEWTKKTRLLDRWEVEEKDRQAKAATEQRTWQENYQRTVGEYRTKRADVNADEVFGENGKPGVTFQTREELSKGNVMGTLMKTCPNYADVLYYCHDNPEELARIRALPDLSERLFELRVIARQLASTPTEQKAPSQPAVTSNIRPISRVPAVPKHNIGGGPAGNPAKKSPDEQNYDEYRSSQGGTNLARTGSR